MKPLFTVFQIILLFLLFLSHPSQAGKRKRVLFLGNSYVTTNNLPGIIGLIATSQGDTLVQLTNAPGGFTLSNHYSNPTSKSLIAQGGWDIVVIQAQSQEPSFPDGQVEAQTLPFARRLDTLINNIDSCTETQFYMTWGRKNGDAQNCAFYPPLCTFEGMQGKLTERYLRMAEEAKGSVSPVGEVWKKFRSLHPTIELYSSDGSHPSLLGTYLAGLVFYQSIYQKDFSQTVYKPVAVPDSSATFMQQLVSQMLADSAEKWFGKGRLARSRFTHQSQGLSVQFQNQSFAAQSWEWNFGDGQTSNLKNPNHTYTQPGTYSVSLKASNPCENHMVSRSIQVIATNMTRFGSAWQMANPIQDELEIPAEMGEVQVMDALGRRLLSGRSHLSTQSLSPGIYHLIWTDSEGRTKRIRVLKNQ